MPALQYFTLTVYFATAVHWAYTVAVGKPTAAAFAVCAMGGKNTPIRVYISADKRKLNATD